MSKQQENFRVAVLAGDGIGPEVMAEALKVLAAAAAKFAIPYDLREERVGGCAIDADGVALPDQTLQTCKESDAILFGSVGGPKWEKLPPREQPERAALLPLRKHFTLFANIRPGLLYRELTDASPLKTERIPDGIDIVCIRELTGGVYFGQPKATTTLPDGDVQAVDTMVYRRSEIERILKVADETARGRKGKLCSVDKANVLETSVLWRKTVTEYVARHAPELALSHMYVDNAAMQLARDPNAFDVIVTENMFGDILTDEAAGLVGGLGLAPGVNASATHAMAQATHGSAPDIAGKGIANPYAMIMSGKLLFDWLGLKKNEPRALQAGQLIEKAVERVIAEGKKLTADLGGTARTAEMGDAVARAIG